MDIAPLYYKQIGDAGTPVIFLHGLLGSGDNWQTFAKDLSLSKSIKCYLLDQRNHGRSPHVSEMNYLLMVEDLFHFIQEKALDKVVIIGHSMGGKVAMLFALLHPERVQQLFVIDIAPVKYPPLHEKVLSVMAALSLQQYKRREEIVHYLTTVLEEQYYIQLILKNIARAEDGSFSWKCNLESICSNYAFLMDFPSIATPFLGEAVFVKGEHSEYVSDTNYTTAQYYFPTAVLHTISKAGHWVHVDQPLALLDLVESLLH